jgi:chaperonin GroES
MKKQISPLNGFVVLKAVDTEETTYGAIIIPDLGSERPEMGEVVGISPTYNYHKGENIPSALTIGQTVLIPKMGSMKITVDGEEFFITKETEILGYLA